MVTVEELLGGITTNDPSLIPLGKQSILLFGDTGSGKTTLASNFPNHLYIDLEEGATNRRIRKPERPIKTWAVMEPVIDIWHTQQGPITFDNEPVDTIIIDTGDKWFDLCKLHVHAEMSAAGEDFEKFGAQYVKPRNRFKESFDKLMQMQTQGRVGIIIICHEHKEEIVTPLKMITKFRPMINDKHWREEMPKSFQLVLWARRLDAHPVSGEAWGKQVFCLQTKVLDVDTVVKDRTTRLPELLPMTYGALEKAYNEGETN